MQCVRAILPSHREEEHEVLEGLQDPIQFIFTEGISLLTHLKGEKRNCLPGAEGEEAARRPNPTMLALQPRALNGVVWGQLSMDSSPHPLALAGPFVLWEE